MSIGASGAYSGLLEDLAAEERVLDALVANLDERGAASPTAAVGWDVRATIEHLAGAEALAAAALTEPDGFAARLAGPAQGARVPSPWPDVLARWRTERARVLDALAARSPRDRIPWIAGDMSAMSFATARLMETWAHGVDVAGALGVAHPVTARLRHVADLGVRTRPFAYAAHGVALPDGEVRVALTAPDGTEWTWGTSTTDVVHGDALDFCLVVTQRRHVDDSALAVTGAHAREWMTIAQAFAGPATTTPPRRGG